MKKISYKISLGGVLASICILMMFITAVFPLLNFALPMFAGTLLAVVAIEISTSWGFVTYAAVAVLSVFVTPDKEASILFIMFFGYYPVFKSLIEKIKFKLTQYLIKFIVFNVAVIVSYYILIYVTGTLDFFEEFDYFGKYAAAILILIGNAVFILYDYTVATIVTCYLKWFRPTFLNKIK